MRNIYILSGIPGSGKSTWMHRHAGPGAFMLSRDFFRDALRNECNSTNYFPYPAAVEWDRWTQNIIRHLQQFPDADIYIDQTTLTQGALNKLFRSIAAGINADNDNIIIVRILCNLKTALARNAERTGFACVPEQTIRSMEESMRKNPIAIHRTVEAVKDLFHSVPAVSMIYENMED